MGIIVVLFQSRESSAAIILRAPATLLVAKVLASVGSEESCHERLTQVKPTANMLLLTNMLRVFAAALHLGLVVWFGERLFFSCHGGIGSIGGEIQLRESVENKQNKF